MLPAMVLLHQPYFAITCWLGVCAASRVTVMFFVISTLSYLGFVPVFTAWSLKCHYHGLFGLRSVVTYPHASLFLLSPSQMPYCITSFIPHIGKCQSVAAVPCLNLTLVIITRCIWPENVTLLCCSRICYYYNSELAVCWLALFSFVALQVVEKLSLLSLILLVRFSKFCVPWISYIFGCPSFRAAVNARSSVMTM